MTRLSLTVPIFMTTVIAAGIMGPQWLFVTLACVATVLLSMMLELCATAIKDCELGLNALTAWHEQLEEETDAQDR